MAKLRADFRPREAHRAALFKSSYDGGPSRYSQTQECDLIGWLDGGSARQKSHLRLRGFVGIVLPTKAKDYKPIVFDIK